MTLKRVTAWESDKTFNSGPLHMSPVNRAGSVSEISPRHSFLRKIFDMFI